MAIAGLVAVLLVSVFTAALGWVALAGWLLIALATGTTLVAVVTRSGVVALTGLGAALACWSCLLVETLRPLPRSSVRPGLARMTVEPLRTACGLEGCWAEARLLGCSEVDPGSCAGEGGLVSISTPAELPLGARIRALGSLAERPGYRNPSFASGWPDTRPGLRARVLNEAAISAQEVPWLSRWLLETRRAIRGRFDATLHPPHAGIARALLLGEGSAVATDLNDAIRAAGVSHVLAVSGMHVTVLVGGIAALVRALWLHSALSLYWEARRVAAGVGALLAPLVASLCGGSPSAVRAALTSTLMFALTALGYRPSALAVAAFAVALHIAADPRDALHPGFVLSVAATAALLTSSCQGAGGLGRALRESLRAWLATAPFLVLCFGSTSLVAIAANIVLLPLGTLLIPLCVAHLGAAALGLSSWLGSGSLFEAASGAFLSASRLCASLDPGLRAPAPTPLQLAALGIAAGCCLLPSSRRLRLSVAAAALAIVAACEAVARLGMPDDQLRVVFLDVGQGDAAILQSGSQTALIDAGGRLGAGPDPGLASVLPVLASLRVQKLDLAVLSHPHPDHYGGLAAVISELPVAELWDTGQAEAEGMGPAADLLGRARANGTRVLRPDQLCGAPRRLGSAELRVIAPCPSFDAGHGPNDNSFVLRVVHGRRSFLFTGDVEQAAEAQLLSAQPRTALRSDVLKVAHHGSRTSSTQPLLRAVAPWLAVVSAGRGNRFGHPHEAVLQRLSAEARHTLRIDEVGGVQVLSDGSSLRVDAWERAVDLRLPR